MLAGGSTRPRDLPVPGRELKGIHFAMEYLTLQNRRNEGETIADAEFISAKDKHVIIIGGGDTGADCLGTAHRQGAASVHQLELLPRPPDTRAESNPWPLWPNIFRVSSAHEEGGERLYSISTQQLQWRRAGPCDARSTRAGSRRSPPTDAMEFKPVAGTEQRDQGRAGAAGHGVRRSGEATACSTKLGVKMTERGNVWRDERWMTSVPGVFTAGDMQRGQSLIVWAIAEGRSCAARRRRLSDGPIDLPAPLAGRLLAPAPGSRGCRLRVKT